MKKVFQTKFGSEGNCFAACIASLVETDIENLPFLSNYKDNWDKYLDATNEYLRTNFEIILLYNDYEDWADYINDNFKNSFYIVSGDSNKDGLEHAVLYKNGKLNHNPNDRGTEIVNIKHAYVFLKLHF